MLLKSINGRVASLIPQNMDFSTDFSLSHSQMADKISYPILSCCLILTLMSIFCLTTIDDRGADCLNSFTVHYFGLSLFVYLSIASLNICWLCFGGKENPYISWEDLQKVFKTWYTCLLTSDCKVAEDVYEGH